MPRRDGTGPLGTGSITGIGLGMCTGAGAFKCGSNLGLGLAFLHGFGGGFRRNLAVNQIPAKTRKELLTEQKDVLQSRLENIDKQLENL